MVVQPVERGRQLVVLRLLAGVERAPVLAGLPGGQPQRDLVDAGPALRDELLGDQPVEQFRRVIEVS